MIQPRFRIYSTPKTYFTVLMDFLSGNRLSSGDKNKLESALKKLTNSPYALPMPQCRVGIYHAVKHLVPKGKKVILSPYTLTDVINMVVCAGAVPVFVDIERSTCNISPEAIEASIDEDTVAILVTHLHGLACDMTRIKSLCEKYDLKLIEDAAQSFGARHEGQFVGTFGDAGVFSFGMYKAVNSFYGGMLLTRHETIENKIRKELNSYPQFESLELLKKAMSGLASDIATWPPLFTVFTFWVFRYAYLHDIDWLNRKVKVDLDPKLKTAIPKYYLRRMTGLQASLVMQQLSTFQQFIERRIKLAQRYYDGLKDVSEILLPPMKIDGSHVYSHIAMQVPEREKLIAYMIRNGQDVAIQHLKNCASLSCFSDYSRNCPNAEKTAAENILISSYARYSESAVDKNISLIRRYYGY